MIFFYNEDGLHSTSDSSSLQQGDFVVEQCEPEGIQPKRRLMVVKYNFKGGMQRHEIFHIHDLHVSESEIIFGLKYEDYQFEYAYHLDFWTARFFNGEDRTVLELVRNERPISR